MSDALEHEISSYSASIRTDAIAFSVGELVNMYRDGEIIIDPEFQRLFRWDMSRRSGLIESLLLSIPIPSLFLFERQDGVWELIDGLQRLSTILEFMGELKKPNGKIAPPSVLEGTTYLKQLHNAVWKKSDKIQLAIQDQNEIGKSLQLAIKRGRLSIQILKKPSDQRTKYDLFQRLNSGGIGANAQEIRNCIMIMANRNMYKEVRLLTESSSFQTVFRLKGKKDDSQRGMELATRLLVHTFSEYDNKTDVEQFIDEQVVLLADNLDPSAITNTLSPTVKLLEEALQEDALRPYRDGGFKGKLTLVGVEGIAAGLARNIEGVSQKDDPVAYVTSKAKSFWSQPQTDGITAPGMRGTTRIQRSVPFGAEWFSD